MIVSPAGNRRSNLVSTLLAVALLLSPQLARAATYYVDPTCETSGDGTTTAPGPHGPFKAWGEITARNLWAPGNTYSQKGGTTTRENIVVGASGAPCKPITLNSYGTGKATIIAAKDVGTDGWTEYPAGSGIYRKQIAGSRWFWADGAPVKAAYDTKCPEGTFTYEKAGGMYTYYHPAGNAAPSAHKLLESLWDASATAIDIRERSHIVIDGLHLQKGWYGVWHGNNTKKPSKTSVWPRRSTKPPTP